MSTLKKIDIVFENCESITLEYPHICYIKTYGYKEDFANYLNCIVKNKIIDGFELIVSKTAKIVEEDSNLFDDKKNPIDRIMNDITQLHITYEDDSVDSFLVSWPHDETGSDTWHTGQKVIKTASGNIYVISKNKMHIDEMTESVIDYTEELRV